MPVTVGQASGIVARTTPPSYTNVGWFHVNSLATPTIGVLKFYNLVTAQWEPLNAAQATAQAYFPPVLTDTISTPPSSPSLGDRYLIPATPAATGAWAGFEKYIAEWNGAGWNMTNPNDLCLTGAIDQPGFIFQFQGTMPTGVWAKYDLGAFTPLVVDITYANLLALQGGSALIKGRNYRIIDFATKHNIPNTSPTVTNTGTTEPLIVRALSNSVLDKQAYSELYPQDTIYYELVDSSTAGGNKGRIYYRRSAENITAGYDWRNVKFRRWETSLGSGILTLLSDPGGGVAFADFYTFNNVDGAGAVDCFDVNLPAITDYMISVYGAPSDRLNNLIVKRKAKNCYFGIGFSNTFELGCFESYFAIVKDNTFLSDINKLTSFNIIYSNTIDNQISESYFYGSFGGNTLSGLIDKCFFNIFSNNTGVGMLLSCDFRDANVSGFDFTGDWDRCTLRGDFGMSGTLAVPAFQNRQASQDGSNFDITIDITGVTAITATEFTDNQRLLYGLVTLTSSNASETINAIIAPLTNFKRVKFYPDAGKTITFVATPRSTPPSSDQIYLASPSITLVGGSKDYLELESDNGNPSITYEIDSQIYF